MRTFALALISASSAALSVADGYDNEYEHSHVEYVEADRFRDIEVLYDEVDYTVNTKIETELRSRQVPVPYEHKETETKY
jgi:hypothetical protein